MTSPIVPPRSDFSSVPDVDANGRLRAAVLMGRLDDVRNALNAGADPNGAATQNSHAPVLLIAARVCRSDGAAGVDVLRALIAAGADANRGNDAGETALMAAAGRGALEGVDALLAAGADPNACDAQGRTALMSASAASNAETMARRLLSAGAAVNAVNSRGDTALVIAAHYNQVGAMQALLRSGADTTPVLCDDRHFPTDAAQLVRDWRARTVLQAAAPEPSPEPSLAARSPRTM